MDLVKPIRVCYNKIGSGVPSKRKQRDAYGNQRKDAAVDGTFASSLSRRAVSMKNLNLQDVFLNQARKDKIPVTVYLINGFQFKGVVKGFDSYVIIMDCDGKQNIVYKHAVSTIIPVHPVNVLSVSGEDGEN